MRFEERLRATFDIDIATRNALLPAAAATLVENAIKYAVGAQESGAEIRIETQLVGRCFASPFRIPAPA